MRSNYAGMKISGLEITRNKTTCRQITTSMQLQNRSFQVVYWKRTAAKCAKLKNARATCAKLLVFIVKYANLRRFRLPSRPGYLSSLQSFPHGQPLRFEISLNNLIITHRGPQLHSDGFRNQRETMPQTTQAHAEPCHASNL